MTAYQVVAGDRRYAADSQTSAERFARALQAATHRPVKVLRAQPVLLDCDVAECQGHHQHDQGDQR